MKLTGLAISMGVGLAAGAVTALMLPKNCTARRMATQAAEKAQDMVDDVMDKMTAPETKA